MRRALALHPDCRCAAVTGIEVEVGRPRAGALVLRYLVTGVVRDLRMPLMAAPLRSDGLWQHTCFEAFLRTSRDQGYCEFNFAPSTQWAAYRFSGYRSGMTDLELSPPRIETHRGAEAYAMRVELDLNLPADRPWQLGLAAVIEEVSGGKSYWALAHPPGKPDFHHEDCFTLELPPAA